MKTSIICGVTGQDGAFLAQLLLSKGYTVYGTYRRNRPGNLWRLSELGLDNHPNLHLVEHQLTSLGANARLIERVQPDEIYNLTAQSSVASSFLQPYDTAQITGYGPLNWLEAIRLHKSDIRFFQASTAEMFGNAQSSPQNEETPFRPHSPYAVAKLNAHWTTISYRESFGIFASIGILFNHESPLRGIEFLTRKVTDHVAKIGLGRSNVLEVGNLDSIRDWGWANDFVDGMWRTLQADASDTFVFATNRASTVREFVQMAFKAVGVLIEFRGTAEDETAEVTGFSDEPERLNPWMTRGQTVVRVNTAYCRPVDPVSMIGDPAKAKRLLNWSPSTTLEQTCQSMVDADLARAHRR